MPKKKQPESQEEQSERFNKAVSNAVAAGELSPTEADERFEKLVGNGLRTSAPKEP